MNCLGTQHGILKGWFKSGNLQLATSNFINVNQVKNNKEVNSCCFIRGTGIRALCIKKNVALTVAHV